METAPAFTLRLPEPSSLTLQVSLALSLVTVSTPVPELKLAETDGRTRRLRGSTAGRARTGQTRRPGRRRLGVRSRARKARSMVSLTEQGRGKVHRRRACRRGGGVFEAPHSVLRR